MAVAPGLAHLNVIKILYQDKFLAPRQLTSRHCASGRFPNLYQRRICASAQICTATLTMLNKVCTMTAKTRAIPSLHRDYFLAKAPVPIAIGRWPVLASGSATSPYCRAVICKVLNPRQFERDDNHPTYNSIRVRISINVSGLQRASKSLAAATATAYAAAKHMLFAN